MKRISEGALLFFPLSAVISLLLACYNLRNKANSLLFVLFYGFFGFAHSFSDVRADCYRKMEAFKYFPDYMTFDDVWRKYIDGEIFDVFEDFLFVFCKSFTTSPKVLLFIVGLIGGTFAVMTVRLVLRYSGNHMDRYAYILTLFMIMFFNPVAIGGIRNFVAMTVFAYFAFKFLLEKRNLAIIGLLSCVFIHFSFFLNIAVVVYARIFISDRHIKLWWWLAVGAIASSLFVTPELWKNLIGYLDLQTYNAALGYRAESYTSDEAASEFGKSLTVRLLAIGNYLIKGFYLVVLVYFKKHWNKMQMGKFDNTLYTYTLFFLSFGYIMSSFSVVGGRYLFFGQILFCFLLLRLCTIGSPLTRARRYVGYMPWVFCMNIAWLAANSWFVLDHRFFYAPVPFLLLN